MMLTTLWVIDALLLLIGLFLALLARQANASGRGVLWLVPLAVAIALGLSFMANQADAVPLALGLALIGPAISVGILMTVGRAFLIDRYSKRDSD